MTFQENLVRARKARGLSQEDLSAVLLAGGAWAWSRRDLEAAAEAPAESSLPEEFSVSRATFSLAGTEERRTLGYCFTPSISSEEWNDQITFTTSCGISKTFDAVCKGGVCAGEVFLAMYEDYTVTASVVNEAGNSRNIVIAMDLSFSRDRLGWTPVEE